MRDTVTKNRKGMKADYEEKTGFFNDCGMSGTHADRMRESD